MKYLLAILSFLGLAAHVFAQDIELPAPHKSGGMPLMEALSKRATSRAFDSHELSPQQISDLAWAGFGLNRADGKRTAPSSHNKQELELYLLTQRGAFIYDAKKNILKQVCSEDLRQFGAKTNAAICLLYIADFSKMEDPASEKKTVSSANSGFIGQNIYLFCASEGLATGYRAGGFDRSNLVPKLKLSPKQEIIGAQPVGYPKI